MKNWIRRSATAVAFASALSVGAVGLAVPASAANSGRVMCVDQSRVVGVWVAVAGGRSGWASWKPGAASYVASWSYNTQGKKYNLNVGCGGSPTKWAHNVKTPSAAYWSNVTCFPGWAYGFGGVFAHDRCYAG